jgi:uncharacterized protein (TIGR02145 family)
MKKTFIFLTLLSTFFIFGQSKKKVPQKVPVTTKKETSYQSVQIGNQEWMTKNLDVTTFRNGDPIPEAKTDFEWRKAGQQHKPAWCYYRIGFSESKKYGPASKYGKLYNYWAVNDPRGLAPKGWSIPNYNDFKTLSEYLAHDALVKSGRENDEYPNLNEDNIVFSLPNAKSINGWYKLDDYANMKPQTNTNSSGFNALPGGSLDSYYSSAEFSRIGLQTCWWISGGSYDDYEYVMLHYMFESNVNGAMEMKRQALRSKEETYSQGMYVRCIKFKEDITLKANRFYDNGVQKYNAKDYNGAIQEFTSYINILPNKYVGYLSRANMYSWVGDWQKASQDYATAWATAVNNDEAESAAKDILINAGNAFITIGDKSSACKYFSDAEYYSVPGGQDNHDKYCGQ